MPSNSSNGYSADRRRVPSIFKLNRVLLLAAMLFGTIVLASGCAAIKAPPEGGADETPWTTAMHDATRSSSTTVELTYPLRRAWGADTTRFLAPQYRESSAPAIDGYEIYVGATSGRVLSFELYTGRLLWDVDAGSAVESPPSITGTELCVGTQAGMLRCLMRSTGEEIWSYQARTEIASSPLLLDDAVVFASSDDRVYALDRATGKEKWVYSHGTFRTVTPRVASSPAYADGRVYLQFSDSTVVCIDAVTGLEVWNHRTGADLASASAARRTPLVSGGRVYLITDARTVTAFDAATGNIEEVFSIGTGEDEVVDFLAPPSGGVIIASTATVARYPKSSPIPEWTATIESNARTASVALVGGDLVVVSNYTTPRKYFKRTYGIVDALDIDTGHTTWSKRFKGGVSSRPAVAGQRLAVLTDKGDLYVLAPEVAE